MLLKILVILLVLYFLVKTVRNMFLPNNSRRQMRGGHGSRIYRGERQAEVVDAKWKDVD